jgi:hypothetical protein
MNAASKVHLLNCAQELQIGGARLLEEGNSIVEKYFPGCTLEISDSIRDIYVQAGKYSQGRTWNKDSLKWNESNPGAIITRTLNSKHLKNPSEAIDVCVSNGKTIFWPDPVIQRNREFWIELGLLGRRLGLLAGVFWSKPDMPHFEV